MRIIALLIALFVLFIPTIIAFNRDKRNKVAIFVANLLLGWTGIGWALILVWALTED